MINATTIRDSILEKDKDMFKSLLIKIVQPSSSQLIPQILKGLGSFIRCLEIDLNNKSIDFYESEVADVSNISALSFRKQTFNFEKLVENFHEIQKLEVHTQEFQNIKQSLLRQKKLTHLSITCAYPQFSPNQLRVDHDVIQNQNGANEN